MAPAETRRSLTHCLFRTARRVSENAMIDSKVVGEESLGADVVGIKSVGIDPDSSHKRTRTRNAAQRAQPNLNLTSPVPVSCVIQFGVTVWDPHFVFS